MKLKTNSSVNKSGIINTEGRNKTNEIQKVINSNVCFNYLFSLRRMH